MRIENENEFDGVINEALITETFNEESVPSIGAKAQKRKVRNIIVGGIVVAAVGAAAFIGRHVHESSDSE